jgi:DNA excision repair protein ERCC-8
VSSSLDGSVRVWDANALALVHAFRFDSEVLDIAMSPIALTHTLIASAVSTDKSVKLCDLRSSSCSQRLIGHRGLVSAVNWLGLFLGTLPLIVMSPLHQVVVERIRSRDWGT